MHLSPLSRRGLFGGAVATSALLAAPRLATAQDRRLFTTAVAISWFWAMGAVLTSQFVPLV